MWTWLVRFWHTLIDWKHRRSAVPQTYYRRSNLHGRR